MCVFAATDCYVAALLTIVIGVGGDSSKIIQARDKFLQPSRSLHLVATDRHNISMSAHDASHQSSSASALSMKEAKALDAARKHDRFCEEFCYHMYTMDDEEPTQVLREPCKKGCLRMYSQGAMGSCDCDPFTEQDPKGGPLKQGSRESCHTFVDPGQDFEWHASCVDLYPKAPFTVDQPGYRTIEEVTEKLHVACATGWGCGAVMSQCVIPDELPGELRNFKNSDNVTAHALIAEVCSR
eukprot:gnl/MRDRNA2_/MRDRNA2_86967_c0_seq1.p1 gnl/MRDRNA2_/MRDRNA2_86967_c0~~gnl/MRDRNA2_/MRDRNA2_86967_c0_seq1.p1  ORF type:complete len:240 (-),score=38.45 gnl/MRDRNA2_/MRDRNA2_86967_c0_seq1:98-817(-)